MIMRPLKSIRPIGPFSDKFTDKPGEGKQVIGSSGTPMPNKPKCDTWVIYVISGQGSRPFKSREFKNNVQRKINARDDLQNIRVEFLKSGISSTKNFKEQAVLVRIPGSEMPMTESQLSRIQGIIEREVDGLEIKERIYESPGTSR